NIDNMLKIYIESYGCSASQAESEIMAGLLNEAKFDIVKNENEANLIIIVTCYVKSSTEQKILFRIRELQELYPEKKLIIAGCMPEGIYNKLIKIAPKVSLVSTHHIKEIVKAVQKTLEEKRVEYLGKSKEIKLCLPKIRKNPIINIVPISSGCNSACSYCCVKFAKGGLFSYPVEIIIKEIENSLREGCKEIWLTAQDTASYGLDLGNFYLPTLLKEIAKIPNNFFVRVGMMNPKNVLKILSDLIEAYKSKKIYKFLHLPVQSGDDEILEKMNRNYKVKDFEMIVKEFKKNFKFQLWTDIIAGYPGESEEQFKNTINLIKKIKPDYVNISKFGARPKTEASKLKPLPSKIVKERSEIVSSIAKEIFLEKNKEWLNWEGETLVSEIGKKPNQYIGRNFAYKPILIESKENILGRLINVKIYDFTSTYLIGKT
ncbi:MAG: tRNA (N(6)-L-threonylcarbamoyladenosine(37)-C(2))-methylthiotransferase, partial [Candidatus Aenigmatarchaeota archaeon]